MNPKTPADLVVYMTEGMLLGLDRPGSSDEVEELVASGEG